MPAQPIVLRGEMRRPGGDSAAGTVTLEADRFGVAVGGGPPWTAGYRDVATVAVDAGVILVEVGSGLSAERWMFERFGAGLATLARGLRDGRLRQWLSDGLVEIPEDVEIDLVEFATETSSGVAQLLYHDRGVALAPLDERIPRRRIQRAAIGSLSERPDIGGLRVEAAADRRLGHAADAVQAVDLLRLGAAASSHRQRWMALRDGAATDMTAIAAAALADAPFEVRRRLGETLAEGRPISPLALGDAWPQVEQAFLAEPTFAESYRALVARTGVEAARWLAAAPERPGVSESPRVWFFVGLPGNLVAMELVSPGAHATYLFRVVPRAAHRGGMPDGAALTEAVRDVSEALLDSRFLREPMALPTDRLAEPRYQRYRLALAALPTLAAARARFVARVVHRDPESWAAAIDDLVAWHATAHDDSAEWPGRATQESQIDEAGTAES